MKVARAWRVAGWLALALALLFGLWCALGWWVLPPILKTQGEQRLGAALGRNVTIGRIAIDPLRLTVEVDDLAVAAAESQRPPLLRLPRLFVDASLASLWQRAAVLNRIEVDGLRIVLLRLDRRRLDIDDLIQRWSAPGPSGPPSEPPRLVLRRVAVRDAALQLDDARPGGTPHRIEALALDLDAVSTRPADADRPLHAQLALRLDGAALRVQGSAAPFAQPRSAQWTTELEALDLGLWHEDIAALLPLRLATTRMAASLTSRFTEDAGATPQLHVAGRIALTDAQWRYPGGAAAIGWRDLTVQLTDAQPLARSVEVEQIKLDGLALPLVRSRDGKLNLAALVPAAPSAPGSPPAPGAAPPWQAHVGAVQVANANVSWHDQTTAPAAALELAALQVQLHDLRWPLAAPVPLQGSAQIRAAGTGAGRLTFSAKANERAASVAFTLDDFALPTLRPYLASVLVPPLSAGAASAKGRLDWTAAPATLKLAVDDARVDRLAIAGAGWQRLAVTGMKADLSAHRVEVGAVRLVQPQASIVRDPAGRWNFAQWLRPTAAGPATGHGRADAPAWQLALGRFDLEAGRVDFTDAQPAAGAPEPLALRADALQVHARALRWPLVKGARAAAVPLRASGRVTTAAGAQPGTFVLAGRLDPAQPGFTGTLDLQQLALAPLARYAPLPPDLSLANADASYSGQLAVALPAAGARIDVRGQSEVADLRVQERRPAANTDLLRWRSLTASGLQLRTAPGERPAVSIHELRLAGLDARLIVTEQGELNLATVAATAQRTADQARGAAPAAAPSGSAPVIAVDLTRLVDARVDFEDHFIRPNYRAELSALNGQLGAFRSDSAELAPLVLDGRVAGSGKLEISGDLNPTAHPLALNLRARATDVDLPPLSSYSGKYAGYGIASGKLSVDLSYHVAPDGKLEASNRIVLNQLDFGAPVASPSATSLPVRFLVALLKDKNGVIDLDLPISGSIDEPDFHLGRVLLRVLVKVLTRAVASPFAALAGGAGDHPGAIEFVPGTAQLAPSAGPVLDELAKTLADRPALTLEVAGVADPRSEREAFQHAALDARLAALQGAGAHEPPAGEARDRLLRRLYHATALPDKPRNFLGIERDIASAEMARRLQAAMPVAGDAMRDLALQRSLAVRTALIARGLPAERVFVGTPQLHEQEQGEAGWTPRAQLKLLLGH